MNSELASEIWKRENTALKLNKFNFSEFLIFKVSNTIKKLIDLFKNFPTVGPRTAQRFVYYLIKQPKEKVDELINAIKDIKSQIKFCSFCFQPFEENGVRSDFSDAEKIRPDTIFLCEICKNPSREKNLLCIIEKESDLITIENTKKYKGLYFVLGGAVATLKKDMTAGLRIEELKERIKESYRFGLPKIDFTEIIIATNPTPEGKATSILVERALKEISLSTAFKITHLAKGIPVGGELEYADEETLESAFEGRN